MKPGLYQTRAGSVMGVTCRHGGRTVVDFDWFEEGACPECHAQAYDDDGFLVWHCDVCGGGSAKLFPAIPFEDEDND